VFAIIALGFLTAKRQWMNEAGFRGLNDFCFSLAAPALLFAGGTVGHAGAGPAAFAFFTGALVLFGAGLLVARRGLRQPLGEAGLFALNASYGNTVMMGLPLIAAAYGQAGLAILVGILALHSLVLLGLATIVAEIGINAHAPWRRVLRASLGGMARNPIVMSLLLAMLVSQLGIPVPQALRRMLDLLGGALPPVALFVLGGGLAAFDPKRAGGGTVLLVSLKLLVMPALVWGCCLLFGLGRLETAVAVTAAAMPTGANAFLLARRYGGDTAGSGAVVLISTLLSIGTLGLLLGWFGTG
ncbi:MAG TPA: AEC family transporter, partial [Roseomonas sp.]